MRKIFIEHNDDDDDDCPTSIDAREMIFMIFHTNPTLNGTGNMPHLIQQAQ